MAFLLRRILLERYRLLLLSAELQLRMFPRRQRRMWVRDIFTRREALGEGNLISELRKDPEQFFGYFRMSPQLFDELLNLVEPRIAKKNTNYRKAIPPEVRLALTLRYLATGCSYKTLSFSFRVGHSTVCGIIEDTCTAIWELLQPIYLKLPSSEREWRLIAQGFQHRWNFPMCVAAIDGMHVYLQAPCNAGSEYYNYKHRHSVILLATCDSKYCFTMIDVGDSGRHNDGGVFYTSNFGRRLVENRLNFPPDENLPCSDVSVPYCIVGDGAFPLRHNLMRPYPGKLLPTEKRIFNYRLSRARRIIENTFGILRARWRVFTGTIMASPDKVIIFCRAACCLHNFLQTKSSNSDSHQTAYCPNGFVDTEDANGNIIPGDWRRLGGTLSGRLGRLSTNTHSRIAAELRERYTRYFVSPEGELPWQRTAIQRGF